MGRAGKLGSINCRYWKPETAIKALLAKNDIESLRNAWPYFKNRVANIENAEILQKLKELNFID